MENINTQEELIREQLSKVFDVIAEKPTPEEGQPYYLEGYHGCGVYRLAILEGRIVGTLHGGYHDSNRLGIDDHVWINAVNEFLTEKFGDEVKFIKADGSGCRFYLRDPEDASYIASFKYNVPSTIGVLHQNLEIAY